MTKLLDISNLKTVEDLNSTDFSKYACKEFKNYVRHINNPVAQDDLERICDLAHQEGSKVKLNWRMGELYYKVRALPQIKKLRQEVLPNM